MDKKNFIIGVVLVIAAFAVFALAPRSAPPPASPGGEPLPPGTPGGSSVAPAAVPGVNQPVPPAPTTDFAQVSQQSADAQITVLRNDFVEARFTNFGGALRDVALIKRDDKGRLIYPEELGGDEPFVFNALHAEPMLALVDFPGLDRQARYELVSQTANEVVYRAVLEGRFEVTRRYLLAPNAGEGTDPHQIRHETTFRSLSPQPLPPMRVSFSIGTAAPTSVDDPATQLATGYSNGEDQEFILRGELEASNGFLGIGARGSTPYLTSAGPLVWTAVKNQFFTSILTGDEPAGAMVTRRVKLISTLHETDHRAYGIAGVTQFDLKGLQAAGEELKVGGSLYVGPKEYRRLANPSAFKADQDKVMDFGFFKFFSQILLTLMTWIHGWTANWGVAIVLTTLFLKTMFIPFTLAASKSAKRMAKLQPELQAIREKHKDNPQKQQQATMELFRTRKINPVGGCFPILLTIPFFIGFFSMLQSAAELRFSPFLWAPDLSAVDTIFHLWIIPIRPMPLLMGATMVIQMHVTPTPSVDNMQIKMMRFMPYIFTFFCYNFSCALSLYSFTNGLFTIGQQLVINRMKDPEEAGPVGAGTAATTTAAALSKGSKAVKNVTPKKKK